MGFITDNAIEILKAIFRQAEINCDTNTDEQALEVQRLYPNWEDIEEGTELVEGNRVNYEGVLYNVKQTHNKQVTWTPKDASTLFTPTHGVTEGTIDNPIVWVLGMEAEKDLYYIDEDIKYLCIESSGVGLYAQPKDLARYFQVVTE